MKPKFEDAIALSIKHPETFSVPTTEDIDNVSKGIYTHVKVAIGGERFWVIVTSIDTDEQIIKGEINNDLLFTEQHGLKCGDEVELKYSNVYSLC